ncbi:MAG: hypothetical protein ACT4SY_09510 [Hyphomicrobiales bacterium]
MIEWSELRPSMEPRPLRVKPHPSLHLRPGLFARLSRFAVLHPVAVLAVFIILAAASLTAAYFRLDGDARAPAAIELDPRTAEAQAALARHFPGIETTFFAHIEAPEPQAARRAAEAVAAQLRQRADLFTDVDIPGTGPFYERYGVFFSGTGEIDTRIRRAVAMLPLFHALRAAPDLGGLTALVAEIGRALEQGRSPEGLEGLLLAAAASVESEIKRKPRPLDWPALAGLSFEAVSPQWFVIATPAAGREREAAQFARAAKILAKIEWLVPALAEPRPQRSAARDYWIPAAIALVLSAAVLGFGLGSGKLLVAVAVSGAAAVSLTAGFAAYHAQHFDSVTSLFIPAAAAPALLLNVVFALAYEAARRAGSRHFAAIMQAAQGRGAMLLTLAGIVLALWITWIFSPLPSLAALAVLAAFATVAALLGSLLLLPACLTVFGAAGHAPREHWFDAAMAVPASRGFRNFRQSLVAVLLPVSLFSTLFLTGLAIGDGGKAPPRASLDGPAGFGAVHLIVPPGDSARQMIPVIGAMPEVGAIRWIELFLPQDVAAKRAALARLAGFLPPLPPPAPQSTLQPAENHLAALEAGLRTVADHRDTAPELRRAAHRLRRAVAIFTLSQPLPEDRIEALEASLFGGFGALHETAERLSRLPEPEPGDFDPGLRRRFQSPQGLWRIEVLPRAPVASAGFAEALRRFSPSAAGDPIVALARGEIMRGAAFTALAAGLALAAFMAVAYLQRPGLTLAVLVPLPMAIGLSAAAIAAAELTVTPAGLAAASMALAFGLASAAIFATHEMSGADASAARRAILPPLVFLAGTAPLSISALPALQDFGTMAALLLPLQLTINCLVVPQVGAWTGRR